MKNPWNHEVLGPSMRLGTMVVVVTILAWFETGSTRLAQASVQEEIAPDGSKLRIWGSRHKEQPFDADQVVE